MSHTNQKQPDAASPEKEELLEQEAPQDTDTQQEEAPQQEDPIEAMQRQLEEANDRFLRLSAEFDNFRKRSQREKEQIYPDAVAATVAKFLPILDNFERAVSFESQDHEFKKGMEMILTSFLEVLGKLEITAYGAPGDPFNPDIHNAVMHEEDGELGENVIKEVFQKGYLMGERVIRHAMVKVVN